MAHAQILVGMGVIRVLCLVPMDVSTKPNARLFVVCLALGFPAPRHALRVRENVEGSFILILANTYQ